MGRTIRTCKLALAAALVATPAMLAARTDDAVDRYAEARLAEIDNRNGEALAAYLELYRASPDSAVLTDRILTNAVRSGDMAAAVRAVRTQELRGEVSSEAPLLLFADAFRQKKWAVALLAADELATRSNFGFMAPILKAWVDVAQGRPYTLPEMEKGGETLFDFYATDQRAYLYLATGEIAKAKLALRNMALVGGDPMRDLFIVAAPIIAKSSDQAFADALMGTALGPDGASFKAGPATLSVNQGLAALHSRISAALLEQGITEPALTVARVGLWLDPENAPARLATAKSLAALGDTAAALALLEPIAPTSPFWLRATSDKIAMAQTSGQAELASQIAHDGIKSSPNSLPLAVLVAHSLEKGGDARAATAQYRQIVDASDKASQAPRQRANYRLLLASSLDATGDWPSAKAVLEAGLVLDPNNAQLLNYLGYSMLERNEEAARASEMIGRAYQIAPESVAIADSMGWVHYRKGEIAAALPLLEKAAKAAGNDAAINEHLGDAYWSAGRRREARYAWKVAASIADISEVGRIERKIDLGLVEPHSAP